MVMHLAKEKVQDARMGQTEAMGMNLMINACTLHLEAQTMHYLNLVARIQALQTPRGRTYQLAAL